MIASPQQPTSKVRQAGLLPTALFRTMLAGGMMATPLVASAATAPEPASTGEACETAGPGGPMLVTASCTDPVYNADTFVTDSVTTGVVPTAYTKVVGHFKATDKTPEFGVSIYLPPAEQWQGRFFQHVYPLEEPEHQEHIQFALSHGGYYVKVKGVPCGCGGYRPEAAAAKIAKRYAQDFYKSDRRIYGYIWGGSGGGLLSLGAIENTQGVWEGGVPYVMPSAGSTINVNAMGALNSLVLHDKYPAINAALKPGAKGDPEASLTPQERAIFRESLSFGVPLKTFETATTGGVILMFLSDGVREADPGYTKDFWTKPGYEGSNPPDYLQKAKVDHTGRIASVVKGPQDEVTAVTFEQAPPLGSIGTLGMDFTLLDARGAALGTLHGSLMADRLVLAGSNDPRLLSRLAVGGMVRMDNLFYLAMTFYHRHTLPPISGMYTYDQYRKKDGTPLYPQRSYLGAIAQTISTAGGGSQTGHIRMKVILNQNLLDTGALAWQADWYSAQVRRALGDKQYEDNFRLYYNDNAEHFDIHPDQANFSRVIWYVPSLFQSLLDVSAWVERGVAPPPSSTYSVSNGQVTLAKTADARRGLQPVVDLAVKGGKSIEVKVGEAVSFSASAQAPSGTGQLTRTAWWFGEDGVALPWHRVEQPMARLTLSQTHSYAHPGTYYVTFGAAAERRGDASARLTEIENLDRVRVIVR